jgi:predicted enzyme related to lactoylglutathione lyase
VSLFGPAGVICRAVHALEKCCIAIFNGEDGLSRGHGRFAWYELLTTDVAAASAFYREVVGWSAKDASTAAFSYSIFTADTVEVGGLMNLPPEGRRMGAAPRWIGYVAVDDIDATAERLTQLGGRIYVPPTDSNIGRVSILIDPQTAALGMVGGLRRGGSVDAPDAPGLIGWHELLATDAVKAFAFYRALFDWQASATEKDPQDFYQPFAVDGRTIGGVFNKLPRAPVPFWLYYFNVADMDTATAAVRAGGGKVVHGPFELTPGHWITRCIDPQGAMFALQGKRRAGAKESPDASQLTWAAEWGGFTSRGKVLQSAGQSKSRPKK